jgi:predicted nucleic acid-binding protein
VYDALVGATAVEHGLKLATRDQRALVTYRALQVDVEALGDDEIGRA